MVEKLTILGLRCVKSDGTRVFDVKRHSDGLGLPETAYAADGAWNEKWKAGDVVECDVSEKKSAAGNSYLSLQPTPAQVNAEPSDMSPTDVVKVHCRYITERFNVMERNIMRKVNAALGIEEDDDDVKQPNFTPDK